MLFSCQQKPRDVKNFMMPHLFPLLLLILAPLAVANERGPFQPMDVFKLQWVKDPQISPDGKSVVYVRGGFDAMKDASRSTLWLINRDGSGHQPLSPGNVVANSPRWSPDGSAIAYVSDAEGSMQIHIVYPASGRSSAVTSLTASPGSLTWSPDGQQLAFTQFVQKDIKPIAEPLKKPEGAQWAEEPRVYQDSFYRADGGGYLKSGKSQIFVAPVTGGGAFQLTHEDYPHTGSLSWTPDSRAIYFSSHYASDWQIDRTESNIYRVDVATGEIQQLTDRVGPDYAPAVSPNGKWLVYLGYDQDGSYRDPNLYITAMDKFEPRLLAFPDRPISKIIWSADSRAIYMGYVDKSVVKVARVSLGGELTDVATQLGGTAIGRPYASGSFSVARDGSVAHNISEPQQPANLAISVKGKARQITNLNKQLLEHRELGVVEEIWFESSFDGLPVQGWIVTPPGFDPEKKYPLILEIHGGPYSAYAGVFSAEVQLYAAAGHVVLYTNPRGSTSYGGEFSREIHHDYPGNDYFDLMSGVDAVIERGYIDDRRLYVTGGSGGGILTAWIVTQTDRFRAAVSQKPVINWYTLTLTSDIGPFFWPLFFDALPWENPEAYLAKSPISFVDKVTTPTMLLTGAQDFRTPMSETEQFYQGLQLAGVDTALVQIRDSGHSIAARPSNLLRKVSFILGWFDRYANESNEKQDAQSRGGVSQ